jgi:hypothetical protein
MFWFYQLFGVVFVLLAHVMPPPPPYWNEAEIRQWSSQYRSGILLGFGICFFITGLVASCNALIAYSMRRMSVSKAFALSYLIIYSLSAIPGMLFTAIFLTVGAICAKAPEPELRRRQHVDPLDELVAGGSLRAVRACAQVRPLPQAVLSHHVLGRGIHRFEDARVGAEGSGRRHVHDQQVLLILLLSHRDSHPARLDGLRRAQHRRLSDAWP